MKLLNSSRKFFSHLTLMEMLPFDPMILMICFQWHLKIRGMKYRTRMLRRRMF
nr:hypothetical protein Iba_chr10aCG9730 [Ipomoea batatas]